MMLKQQLHQRQVQRLILAPALQQAIKLLPLTNLDLIEIIDTELAQNPMLEVQEETAKEGGEESQTETEEWTRESPEKKQTSDDQKIEDDKEFESYFQEYFDDGIRSFSLEKKESLVLENFVSKSISLWDHLNWQANLTFFEEKDKEIAQFVIGNISKIGTCKFS